MNLLCNQGWVLLHLRVLRCCRWKRFSWLRPLSQELKPLPAVGPSVQSYVMAFSWQGALLLTLAAAVSVYAGNVATVHYLNLNIYEWKPEHFAWCPSQTWNWTVGLIMWCWCGRRADHRSTPRSLGWVTVSPPVFRTRRPFSVWMSTVVTSGGWWVILLSAKWESTML